MISELESLADKDAATYTKIWEAFGRVLKEGKVLFARDEDALYAVAIRAARAFEGFRHRYRAYLDEVARG